MSPEAVRRRILSSSPLCTCSVKPDIDWDKLGFGLTPTAAMYVATCARGEEVSGRRMHRGPLTLPLRLPRAGADHFPPSPQWSPGSLRAYGPLELSPAAGVLNYGQVRRIPPWPIHSLENLTGLGG